MGRPPIQLDNAEVASRYLCGSTAAQIAKEFGCSVPTIINRLEISGVKRRVGSGGRRGGAKKQRIIDAVVVGRTITSVAEQFNVSRQYVSQVIHSVGIRRDDFASRPPMKSQIAGAIRRAELVAKSAAKKVARAARYEMVLSTCRRVINSGGSWNDCGAILNMSASDACRLCLKQDPSMRRNRFGARRKRKVSA